MTQRPPDVLEGALKIAREEYPDLDIPAYRHRVEEFAREARKRVTGEEHEAIARLNDFFFDRLGFHGNTQDYDDPRNSYLNDVIDRRMGIPITLSAVYCEIGRRLGLPTFGVGFPGHFLVKCPTVGADIIVDCFHGKILSWEDCQSLLESLFPNKPRLNEAMLEIAKARDILSRMLANLRRIHTLRGDLAKAVRWIEMDMKLKPDDFENHRERGLLYIRLELFGKALKDLETYLARAPNANDGPQVKEQITLLKKLLSHLN